jgi:RNA polymerase sigma-70 factor (ECF subfamily)
MFIVDSWNGLLRFVFWMAPTRPPKGGVPPSGSGGDGGFNDDPEDFFKKHFGRVRRQLRSLGASPEDAEDLTQETFLRVYRNIETFRGEANVETWIFKIARNVWLNHVRGRKTESRSGTEVSLDDLSESGRSVVESQIWRSAPEPVERLLGDEKQRKLYEALGGLPTRMRQCILLRVQDLKYREIAVLMGIDIGTVKALIYQAKERLKKELGPYFDSFDLGNDEDGE